MLQSQATSTSSNYIYDTQVKQTEEVAKQFKEITEVGNPSRFLMYRGIPELIEKYVEGRNAIDYGAGTGLSSIFLKKLGFDVIGVDIADGMLAVAKQDYPEIDFVKCEKDRVYLPSNSFDLLFSSLVLFEIESKDQIISYLKESHRLLKEEGVMVAVAGSEYMYSGKDLAIFNNNYPENENLESGKKVKTCLTNTKQAIEFTDYYWTREDYVECFQKAGFEVLEISYPLGEESDPFVWEGEKEHSPYVIFVARAVNNVK